MNNLTGKILSNRYYVESFVGRGGMAEVYKVWDEQRAIYLALKLLREDLHVQHLRGMEDDIGAVPAEEEDQGREKEEDG